MSSREPRPVLSRNIVSIDEAVQATDSHPRFGGSLKEMDGGAFLERQKKARVVAITLQSYLQTHGNGYTKTDRRKARNDMKRALRQRLGFISYLFWIDLCVTLVLFFLEHYFAETTPRRTAYTDETDNRLIQAFRDELHKSVRSPVNGEFTQQQTLTAEELQAIDNAYRSDNNPGFSLAPLSL